MVSNLIVHQECPHQTVEIILGVKVFLELIERLVEMLRRRRNESGWNSNLVLYRSELPRLLLCPANAVHENCVKLSDEPKGKRQGVFLI